MTVCTFRCLGALALVLGVLLWSPATARAGLLPINYIPNSPQVGGSNGSIAYTASTGDFKVALSAASLQYTAPLILKAPFFATFTGVLSIDLTVDHNGNFVANGTGVSLTGTLTLSKLQDGATPVTFSGTLLTGTVTNFGAQMAGPPSLSFDGYFSVTGGALTQTMTDSKGNSVFGGFSVGQLGGFQLVAENVTSGTLGDFTSSFSSSSVKPTLGMLTPEPGTLALWLTGGLGLLSWRRPQLWRRLLPWRRFAQSV